MIQKGTYLNVVDNTGAKKVCCIHVYGGYRKKYGYTGSIILVSVKSLRKKKKEFLKVKKGEVVKALIVKTKIYNPNYSNESAMSFENSVILLNKQTNKLIGSRVFTSIEKKFRLTRYLRILSICSGIIK